MAGPDNLVTESEGQNGNGNGMENESDDLEKSVARVNSNNLEVSHSHGFEEEKAQPGFFRKLASMGVELRGIRPVALEDRKDRHPINIFSFWWAVSLSVLP